MNKQQYLILFIVLFLGLGFSIFQYSEIFKTEIASATSTTPNPGHTWSSMECNSDILCIDATNKRLGIGTNNPGAKLDLFTANASLPTAAITTGAQMVGLRIGDPGAGGNNTKVGVWGNLGTLQSGMVFGRQATGWGTFIAFHTHEAATTGVDNLIERMRIDSEGNVGIGTTNPAMPLTVVGGSTGTIRMVTVSGTAPYLDIVQSSVKQWGIVNPASTNRLSIVEDGSAGIERLTVANGGNVGIGTTSPGYKLTVAGTAWVTSGSWSGSDIRWKKNVSTLSTTSSLDKILKLNPVTYKWKTDEYPEMNFSDGSQLGFIAQDVENIIPEVVTTDNNGYKGISYEKIVPVLTSAIQEQQKEIDNLSNENKSLKELICLDHPSAEVCK